MFGLRAIVLADIGVFGAGFTGAWGRDLVRLRRSSWDQATRVGWPSPPEAGVRRRGV
jgi:hypothetical protein